MGKTIEIPYEDGSMAAYLAEPTGSGPFPALVLLHEWWGLNDHIRHVAERFAAEGFLALAPDLYAGNVAEEDAEADVLMKLYREEAPEKALAAYDALAARGDARRIGSVGWCMGGQMSFHLAIYRPKLNACVVFYGRPESYFGMLWQIRCPLLGLFSELDASIPAENLKRLDEELHEAAIAHDLVIYPGADHAFFNDRGHTYHEEAAQDAWRRALSFLEEHLG